MKLKSLLILVFIFSFLFLGWLNSVDQINKGNWSQFPMGQFIVENPLGLLLFIGLLVLCYVVK
jgi:hypothetical protein